MEKLVQELINLTKSGSIVWRVVDRDSSMPFTAIIDGIEFKIFNINVIGGKSQAHLYISNRHQPTTAHKQDIIGDQQQLLQLSVSGYTSDSKYNALLEKLYSMILDKHYSPKQADIMKIISKFKKSLSK